MEQGPKGNFEQELVDKIAELWDFIDGLKIDWKTSGSFLAITPDLLNKLKEIQLLGSRASEKAQINNSLIDFVQTLLGSINGFLDDEIEIANADPTTLQEIYTVFSGHRDAMVLGIIRPLGALVRGATQTAVEKLTVRLNQLTPVASPPPPSIAPRNQDAEVDSGMRKYLRKSLPDLLNMTVTDKPTTDEFQLLTEAVIMKADEAAELLRSRPETAAYAEAFKNLYIETFVLIDFGIFSSGINSHSLTAKRDEILAAAKKTSARGRAMEYNTKFNQNLFCVSDNNNYKFDQLELDGGSGMGLINKIVFAMLQEVKRKTGPNTLRNFFGSGQSKQLVKDVCGMTRVKMWNGRLKNYDIKSEIDVFRLPAGDPLKDKFDEILEVIELVALSTAARNNIGSLAALHHKVLNFTSPRIDDGLKSKKPGEDLVAEILPAEKSSTAAGPMVAMDFIDILHSSFMAEGRPANPHDVEDYRKWPFDPSSSDSDYQRLRKTVVWRYEKFEKYEEYEHPEAHQVHRYKYKADHYFTFPELHCLFNQDPNKKITMSTQYEDSYKAMLAIEEIAIKSRELHLPNDKEGILKRIESIIGAFDGEIAKVLSFVPYERPYYDPADGEVHTEASPLPEYMYVHQIIRAAMEFTIQNIFLAIPGEVGTIDAMFPGFIRSLAVPTYDTYLDKHQAVAKKLTEVIGKYTSIKGFYQWHILGKAADMPFEVWQNEFYEESLVGRLAACIKTYHNRRHAGTNYVNWEIANPEPGTAPKTNREIEKAYEIGPIDPINMGGSIWSTKEKEEK